MNVRLVFTASNTVFGRLIRWATKGRASHVMVLYEDPVWGGDWVAEATVGGVKMVPSEKAMHNVVAIFTCKFDAVSALQAVREHIGDGYDYAGIIYFGWAILMWRLFRTKVRRPWRRSSEEYCSEFATMVLQGAERLGKVPQLKGLEPDAEENSPETLFEVSELNPLYFERTTA